MAEAEYLPGGIKERMEDLRNRRKLTLKEVAEKTGIDYSTLSRIENGNVKKVGDDVLLKLARFFGVSTDFLLGITNVPDKKNYTIEELGLTSDAARNLYTGSVNNRVINLLLAHPDFGTLTNRIADYLDDTLAAGIAAQNQLYDSVSDLMMRIGKEEKALRQAATAQAKGSEGSAPEALCGRTRTNRIPFQGHPVLCQEIRADRQDRKSESDDKGGL